MNYYKINGVQMPGGIVEYSNDPTDIQGEAAGRDEAAYFHSDIIREDVRKWTFKHRMLTTSEKTTLKNTINSRGFNFVSPDGEAARCYGTKKFQRVIGSEERWDADVSIIEI